MGAISGYVLRNAPRKSDMDQFTEKSESDFILNTEPVSQIIRVEFGGEVVAESARALLLRESSRVPVYYFSSADVNLELIERTELTTLCPFKGIAHYWSLQAGERSAENVAWSYENPDESVPEIEGYISFYWDRMDTWFADGEPLHSPDRERAVSGINPLLDWMMNEAWEASSNSDLVQKFSRCLVHNGIPVCRFRLIIRTLHPLLYARGFSWTRGEDNVSEFEADLAVMESDEFQNSPLAAIIDGASGVRRRLDIDNPQLDFPVLLDLKEQGITDYVAMPVAFSDGQVSVFSITTERPGGFSTEDLVSIYEIMPLFSRLVEMHYVRRTAGTILDTYLGRQTGQRVLDGKIKRGHGDNVYAVIWFCDLRDSTPLSESMERADFLAMLNQFLEPMAGAVLDNGGEVLRYIGDAALAIFPITGGVGLATPEASRKAAKATRDAIKRMGEVNAARRDAGEEDIGFGIGLHLGDVTYGNIGAPRRLEFTVIGAAENEAARIESLTKTLGEPVLMSAKFNECYPSKLRSVGKHDLKGVSGTHEVFTFPAG
jgi:adenylate cyclase